MSAVPEWFVHALAREATTSTLEVDSTRIVYRMWGEEGRPGIVLVHGGAAHSHWWDHIAPMLAEGGYRVVALDLSGHGDSARRSEYSLGTWGREVLAVAEAAGIGDRPVIIGHSMGGIVSMRLARTPGLPIRRVMVVDSPLVAAAAREEADNSEFSPERRRHYPSREVAVSRFRPIPAQESLPYVFEHIAENSVREEEGGWGWKFDPGLFTQTREPAPEENRFLYPLIFFRAQYGLVPVAAQDAVRAAGGRYVELPLAGHAPMLDQPLALVAAIRTALAY